MACFLGDRTDRPRTAKTRAGGGPRRRSWGALGAAALLLWSAACGSGRSEPSLNVLIVVIDTLRVDRLGLHGGLGGHSSRLDAHAEEFFAFEHAQTTSPWTAPALISLVTGLYPDAHGVQSFPTPERLGPGIRTLTEHLRAAGFETAAFTEGGYAGPHFGLGRGFETFPRDPLDAEFEGINPVGGSRLARNIDAALEWLDAREGRPFLLLLHTYQTHMPYRAPEAVVREVRPDHDLAAERAATREALLAWNERGELDRRATDLLRRHYFLRPVVPGLVEAQRTDELLARAEALGSPLDMDEIVRSPEELALVLDLYDAQVRYVDRELDRLSRELEGRGLDRNTIVLLVSDHGEGLGDRGRLGHGEELHEELMAMLCLLRIPGFAEPPRRIPDVVSMVDLMPTLLELLGVDHDPGLLQGRSLVGVLRGAPARRTVAGHALSSHGGHDPRTSVRDDRWRLILHGPDRGPELFDLAADPGETTNLAGAHPDVVRELTERLVGLRREGLLIRARLRGGDPSPGELDEQLLRELQDLGYVGDR